MWSKEECGVWSKEEREGGMRGMRVRRSEGETVSKDNIKKQK